MFIQYTKFALNVYNSYIPVKHIVRGPADDGHGHSQRAGIYAPVSHANYVVIAFLSLVQYLLFLKGKI